ncbi:MAG: ribosomal L7Ae/L30e/S12e/Gadd45 family protein [Nanoarchaeota archaeon]|nr:ribosomal L7Ae/L30e/S12e/Gadd45 family protein [Nanoarchaeota archaeon]
MATVTRTIKDAAKKNLLLIGTNSVRRAALAGRLQAAYTASNCPQRTLEEFSRFASHGLFSLEKVDENSIRLGEICGKPFTVLVIGITKDA